MTLGMIIKEYRERNRLSQRQFALMCDVSNGYISMLEEGRNPKTNEPIVPSLATMKKLAKAMGMSLNDLMSQTDDMEVNIGKTKKIPTAQLRSEDMEMLRLFTALSLEKQKQALDYVRYLAMSSDSH